MASQIIIECDSDLQRATEPLAETSPKLAVEGLLAGRVEACSGYRGSVVLAQCHAFLAAIHFAFVDHRPLVLSPDMVWLLIAQGFANHVNANSEQMREHFVKSESKKLIRVERNDFYKGSLENPWGEVFGVFSAKIKEEIGEANHSNIVASFSTTGPIEKAACEVVLMDSLKSYFEYEVRTRCGIPEVRLEGTSEDWQYLVHRTTELGNTYGLNWWTDRMLPHLDRIVNQSKSLGDSAFWRSIYKWSGDRGSGTPYFNGWIADFIPYTKLGSGPMCRNPMFQYREQVENRGLSIDCLPSGLSMTPFVWDYVNRRYPMEFIAGFAYIFQDLESLSLRPGIGWAVRDKPKDDAEEFRLVHGF